MDPCLDKMGIKDLDLTQYNILDHKNQAINGCYIAICYKLQKSF